MTYGFTRSNNAYTLRLSAEEAQAVGLVVAQVAGLIQAGDRRGVMSLDLGPSSLGRVSAADPDPFGPGPFGASPRPGDVFDDFDKIEPDPEDLEVELVDDGVDAVGVAGPSADPVLARLFPDGYRDDPEAAAELRSLTESSLREQKIGNAGVILDDLPFEGGEIRLDDDRAEAWLLALNDARLMLGTALEIEADTDPLAELEAAAGVDPTGARVLGLSLYQFLTGLQASLVDAIDPE
ncbi:DUF2017 family protein [Cryptosporangium aurantiacum]|uniref:Uncharacterized protein n=1 Tax=Cryptosporangium aurantiacum TaxID=134849 RepID=A0A1M7QEW2_9ACTN|nr:DUF2017 family protein [Cryptosporangium aurantiacum]SHN29406.1 protein of unknown function [Cryptosporangium aurantiacum]